MKHKLLWKAAKHLEIRELDKKCISRMREGGWSWSESSGGEVLERKDKKVKRSITDTANGVCSPPHPGPSIPGVTQPHRPRAETGSYSSKAWAWGASSPHKIHEMSLSSWPPGQPTSRPWGGLLLSHHCPPPSRPPFPTTYLRSLSVPRGLQMPNFSCQGGKELLSS